jgi:hypothetical protein
MQTDSTTPSALPRRLSEELAHPVSIARSACRIEATSENTSDAASCSGATTPAGEPTPVITISGACRGSTARSSRIRELDRCTIKFAHQGAASGAERIAGSHASVSSTERQLAVGKAPDTPFRQAAATRSTPETRNIGAVISGSRSLFSKAATTAFRLSARSRRGWRSKADRPAPACRRATARRTAWRRPGDPSRHTSGGRRGRTTPVRRSCRARESPR